jgi:hypothetical protein
VDLPAATVAEPGLALALAREELLRAGCRCEDAPRDGGLRLPVVLRCRASPGLAANGGSGEPSGRLA